MNALNAKTIWNYEQNKPSLIVDDLKQYGVPESKSYEILLVRGAFKWFAVRRKLIKLKNTWKTRITNTVEQIKQAKQEKDFGKVMWLRGYLKAYEECRGEVRFLCHSERWQAPDFDKKAQLYLKSLEEATSNVNTSD